MSGGRSKKLRQEVRKALTAEKQVKYYKKLLYRKDRIISDLESVIVKYEKLISYDKATFKDVLYIKICQLNAWLLKKRASFYKDTLKK